MDNLFNNGNNNQNGGNNNQNNGNNNQNGDKKGGNGQMILAFVIITLVTLFFMSLLNRCSADMTSQRITYTEFVQMVKDDKVEKVEVGANQYNITPKSDDKTLVKMTYYTGFPAPGQGILKNKRFFAYFARKRPLKFPLLTGACRPEKFRRTSREVFHHSHRIHRFLPCPTHSRHMMRR